MTKPFHNTKSSIRETQTVSRCAGSSFVLRISSVLLLLSLSAGCSKEIQTEYGSCSGPSAMSSVNGTSVLSDMFMKAGHRVYPWHSLSPRLEEHADCIVWFPDDYKPPSEKTRKWVENWLCSKSGRTLIYVGRDYDAAPFYWQKVQPAASPSQAPLVASEIAFEQRRVKSDRTALPSNEDCEWFTIDSTVKPRKVKTLRGDPTWVEDIDPTKLEIDLESQLAPPIYADTLLASKKDVLVSSTAWLGSRMIVVANGSFLLNVPLVNHEHRKLAGKLIDEIGPPGQTVVFLESGPDGPPIRDKDPTLSSPTGLEIFNIWPTNWILIHLAIVGVVFCFVRWPIFGRARRLKRVAESDFSRHIDAEAEMLKRTGERAFALARLMHYRQTCADKEK